MEKTVAGSRVSYEAELRMMPEDKYVKHVTEVLTEGRCFIEANFDALPIDHKQNRFRPFAKVCNLNLAEASTWRYLEQVVFEHAAVYCHVAPPCGTCSAARKNSETYV